MVVITSKMIRDQAIMYFIIYTGSLIGNYTSIRTGSSSKDFKVCKN